MPFPTRCREPMLHSADAVKSALLLAAEAAAQSLEDTGGLPGSDQWMHAALLDRAQGSIESWHKDAQRLLSDLLAAEQACPEAAQFAGLKEALHGLLSTPGSLASSGGKPDAKERPAASKQALEAAQGAPVQVGGGKCLAG